MTTDALPCRDCDDADPWPLCGTCLGSGVARCRMCGEPAYYRTDEADFCDDTCAEQFRQEQRTPQTWEYTAP